MTRRPRALLTTRVTVAASGDADPAVAWERYARPGLWPIWSPQIQRVECSDARIRAGSTGTVHGPLGIAVRFQVTTVDEAARSWSWRVHALRLTLVLDHWVTPRGSGRGGARPGNRTTLSVHGPAPLALGYAPVAWPALRRLVRP